MDIFFLLLEMFHLLRVKVSKKKYILDFRMKGINSFSILLVFSTSIKNLISKEVRSSFGIGLIFKTPIGRIEVNFNSPLKTCPFDRAQRWQIGFFSEF